MIQSQSQTLPVTKTTQYAEVALSGFRFWGMFALSGLFFIAGLLAFNSMHHHGHYITGMNNQIVWGLPHVFAIFLILSASGAANIATLGSVFKKPIYQPQGRLSLLVAVSLLLGGLVVILLDLGRIDHVIEMLKGALNFSSVFAWNVILYSGFIAIIAIYLWTMMDRTKLAKSKYSLMGKINFAWRIILTTGTGSIFGVLLARHSYEIVTMVPLFLAASYAFGTAMYALVMLTIYTLSNKTIADGLLARLRSSLVIFVIAVLFFELFRYVVNTLFINHPTINDLPLINSEFSTFFWLGQIVLGCILPLLILCGPWISHHAKAVFIASKLIVFGGFCQLYVIIIGGQSHPLVLFPDAETVSSFADGMVNKYTPTLLEFLLGLGGLGLSYCLILLGVKVLRIVPKQIS